MNFVDEARVFAIAGDGGRGVAAFHREPYKPKGGPDGGDGGNGGSVILRADNSVGTLLDLRDHPHIKAEKGGHGAGKRRHGSRGGDRIVLVPPGTVVFDESGTLIADLAAPGEELVAARGGRGGRGNVHFATATRRAPTLAEPGEPGEQRRLTLELRLLADVGLVGYPNAGKSTFISVVSAAKPKIADYPFTTLVPNLGVVKHEDSSFVIADIPGLVPGAHEGKGLGDRFLRHVRRAAVLLFMVDLAAQDRDPTLDVETLRAELAAFDPELAARPMLVAATKIDIARDNLKNLTHVDEVWPISSATGEGVEALVGALADAVRAERESSPPTPGYVRHVVREEPVSVSRGPDGVWAVKGTRVERAVDMTDMNNEEALERLQRRLIAMGVERQLTEAGAKRGDDVRIGRAEFTFEPEGYVPDDAPDREEDVEA